MPPPSAEESKKSASSPDASVQDTSAGSKAGEPKKPTTPVSVTARYEDVPGASKTGPKKASGESALWFDPLTIAGTSPHAAKVERRVGVSKGGGQTIAHFDAALHEEGPAKGEGTGLLTAQLKYASDFKRTYTIRLDGTLTLRSGRAI